MIIIIFCFFQCTFKLTFRTDYEQVYAIEVQVPGVKGIYTEDSDKIKQVIGDIEDIRYYKLGNLKTYNTSPDCYVSLFDKNGKVIEEIEYYGYIAVYNKEKYGVLPFTYNRLEKLCNRLNEKQ